MRKHFYLIIFFFSTAFQSIASTGLLNSSILNVENEAQQPQPDFVVEEISFVSIYFEASSKTFMVKVNVAIRNAGTSTSSKTQMEAQSKTTEGTGSWKVMGSPVNIPPISPGKIYTSELSFKESISSVGTVSFDFRVKIDPKNQVAEANENNNYSKTVLIDPRAY